MFSLLAQFKRIQRLKCHISTAQNIKTAAVIVIGDEILKGDVVDTNSHLAVQELYKMGIRLKKISIIGDDAIQISEEVQRAAQTCNYVITTGGIGPTHDDVTYEGVARAFNEPLRLHPVLRKLCENFFKTEDTKHPGMKLAMVPASAKLSFVKNSVYPNVSVQNVYIFPGVPEFFVKSFSSICKEFFRSDSRFYKKNILLNTTEDKISEALGVLAIRYPGVQIGSYPQLSDKSYKSDLTPNYRTSHTKLK